MNDDRGALPDRIESFIRAIDEARSTDAIFEILGRAVLQVGFEFFSYWVLWPPDGPRQPLCITNYPENWSEYYRVEGYASHDYVGRFAAKSMTPFSWGDLVREQRLTEAQNMIFREGGEAGLISGGTVPIHGPGAAKATFSIASRMDDSAFAGLFTQRRHEIHLIATYVHEKVMGLGLHSGLQGAIRLTPRELEILTWSAKGKSRWEIGVILGISDDTVKTHLENTRRKLHAANTTHAIAIALMHGLIMP